MNKLEVKKFGDTLFLMNNTDRYVVNHEIKEKSDLIIAYRLMDSTNYDMVLSNADYTLNLMQGSTEIRIANNELLKTVHSFKLIMGLEPVDFSTGSISERLQFLEDKVEDYVLFVDGVDEPTTLPPLKEGEFWIRTGTGYMALNFKISFDKATEECLKRIEEFTDEVADIAKKEVQLEADYVLGLLDDVKHNFYVRGDDSSIYALNVDANGFLYSLKIGGNIEFEETIFSRQGKKFKVGVDERGIIYTMEVL